MALLATFTFQGKKTVPEKEEVLTYLFQSKFCNEDKEEILENTFNFLLRVCLADSNSYHYPFDNLNDYPKFIVIDSPDKKIRVYSYEAFGGTMKFYKSYIQYRNSNNQIVFKQLGDTLMPFNDVYSPQYYKISTISNKYVLHGYWQLSSQDIESTKDTININK